MEEAQRSYLRSVLEEIRSDLSGRRVERGKVARPENVAEQQSAREQDHR
jgi:hypothetical protein